MRARHAGVLTMRLPLVLTALLLAGCDSGGGGHGGSARCVSLNTSRSFIDSNCVGCSTANPGDVADGSLYSFADVTLEGSNAQATIRAGNGGSMLPGGTRAGAFYTSRVQLNDVVQGTSFELRTYLNGALVETAADRRFDDAGSGTDAEQFVSFQTTAPFDAVEVVLIYTGAEQVSSADIRVYEICSDGHV